MEHQVAGLPANTSYFKIIITSITDADLFKITRHFLTWTVRGTVTTLIYTRLPCLPSSTLSALPSAWVRLTEWMMGVNSH